MQIEKQSESKGLELLSKLDIEMNSWANEYKNISQGFHISAKLGNYWPSVNTETLRKEDQP